MSIFIRIKGCFLFAQLLLTLIAAVAVHFMAAVILIALLLNGMQHCLASLWKRRILPGTATAACLLIPCSLYYLKSIPFGVAEWLIAPLFMMAAIRLSLYVGSKLLS